VPQVQVIGSGRRTLVVDATVGRVREALAAAGVELAGDPADAEDAPLVVVDPAAWYAARQTPPSPALLARVVGLSLAPYGSPAMQDDAEVGRLLAAIAHPEPRAVDHLRRLGCLATHVPLGAREPDPAGADERPLDLVTFGSVSQRRLRVVAHGAPWFDQLRCAHHFTDDLSPSDEAPFASATVFLDIGDEDEPAPDLALLLEALEAGATVVSERSGDWPEFADAAVVRAPLETVFARASELAGDPARARALARDGQRAAAEAWPLKRMGQALAALLDARPSGAPAGGRVPSLSADAQPPEPRRPIAQIVREESQRPDGAVRHGVQEALHRLRRVERQLEHLRRDGAPDSTEVLREGRPAGSCQVSVLVPCFSARRTVFQTLDSVLAAAAEPDAPLLEVVLVDDASPQDDGAAVVEWAEGRDLALTVVRHAYNRGLPDARNTALEHASGEYVLPLDADDLLRPRGLHKLLTGLQARPDADFAYAVLQEFDTSGPIGLRGLYPWEPKRLRYGNYIPALALIRRAALLRVGGYASEGADQPYQGYEDWDLWCRFIEDGAAGVLVPEIVASYRVAMNSMSANLHLSHVAPLSDMLARHPELLA